VCESLKVRGFQAPGVAQEFFVTEADKLVELPATFTPEQGAFVEPVAVAAHSTGRAGNMQGKNVVVAGAGPIGNLVGQACKARGASRVLLTDVSAYRLDIARQVGLAYTANMTGETLEHAVSQAFGGSGYDVGVDAAGVPASIAGLVSTIQKGGTILILAVFEEKPPVDLAAVCEHELTVRGSMMYRKEDYEQAVTWIADGTIRLEPLESCHFSFDRYLEAYRYIEAEGDKVMKVMIDLEPIP
jgi:L-iditol 2-dehydrogenase/threonine 3-dehydrogenase